MYPGWSGTGGTGQPGRFGSLDPRQGEHGHTHTRSVELALVIVDDGAVGALVAQRVDGAQCRAQAAVRLAVGLEGALQCMRRVVTQHLQEQSPDHFGDQVFVMAEVCHRADCLGQDQKTVRIVMGRRSQQGAHDFQPHHHPGQVIIDHCRVAQMGGEDNALVALSRHHHFTDLERSALEAGADDHLVCLILQRIADVLGSAQTPVSS